MASLFSFVSAGDNIASVPKLPQQYRSDSQGFSE
jgi:hypothetical protein